MMVLDRPDSLLKGPSFKVLSKFYPGVPKYGQKWLSSTNCRQIMFDAISRLFKPELKFCVKSCEIRFILDTEHDELKIKRIFENFIKFRSYV